MSGQNKVDVEILGEHYKLKGDATPEYMVRLARYVDQTMRKVLQRNPKLSIHKAAVLSAVNIADELLRLKEEEDNKVEEELEQKETSDEDNTSESEKKASGNKNKSKNNKKKK